MIVNPKFLKLQYFIFGFIFLGQTVCYKTTRYKHIIYVNIKKQTILDLKMLLYCLKERHVIVKAERPISISPQSVHGVRMTSYGR